MVQAEYNNNNNNNSNANNNNNNINDNKLSNMLWVLCRFKPQEVANMFWALAILKACPPDTWRLLLDKLGNVPVASFDDTDRHQMYQVYLLLDSAGMLAPLS